MSACPVTTVPACQPFVLNIPQERKLKSLCIAFGFLFAAASANAAIVDFEANPRQIESGESVTVSWRATNARSCALSARGQTRSFPTSFSVSAPLEETTTLTLRCGSSTEQLTVNVIDGSPEPGPGPEPDPEPEPEPDPDPQPDPDARDLNFSVVPEVVEAGGTTTASWAASWADSCHAEGFGQHRQVPTVFSAAVTVNETSEFTLTCDGVTESVTARVEEPSDPDPGPGPGPDPDPGSCGDLGRGIADPCAALGFDVFGDHAIDRVVSGGQGEMDLSAQGSASDPYVIDARRATFSRLGVTGQYVIVLGGTVNAPSASGPFLATHNCRNCVVRDVEVSGPGTDESHSSAVTLSDNSVWIGGSIHGFGDNRQNAREQDFHGMKLLSSHVWVIDAEIYDVSGDSIQCGDTSRGSCSNVYISGGYMHDNRENAIDVKDSSNVVISGVRMAGFRPTASSSGNAVILHDHAVDAKVFDNMISDVPLGIVSSGLSGHTIEGNTVTASSVGIQLRNTDDLTVRNNDISAPECVENQGGTSGSIQTGCN